jgi:outer membrane biosynthesis protein TonB
MRLNAHTALNSLLTTSPVMGSAPLVIVLEHRGVPSSHGSTASAGTQTPAHRAASAGTQTHGTAPSAKATPTPAPAFTSRAKPLPQPTPSAKPQPSATPSAKPQPSASAPAGTQRASASAASAAEAAKKAAREAAEVEAIRQAWGVIQHATNRASWYNSTPSRREAVRADNPRYLRRAPRKHTPILEAVHRVV